MSNSDFASSAELSNEQESVISIDHVSMIFNVANERISSLKEYAIKILKHELMFKEFTALDDISFEVKKGDVFGLVGTNGSGKSTMLKIIAGVLEPTKGSCTIRGSIAPLIELGAGFDLELSARENIYLNGALLGYSKQFIDEHFESIVDFADIRDFLEMPMKNYSSGMVARIAFAIATETVPDILIVDEVLSVGDFMFQKKCEKRINSLIDDHGVTVLIVSHDNGLIERLCNKAIWIEKGHTKTYGDAKEVCDLYKVLGGHSGSAASVDAVKRIFETDIDISNKHISTISVEDRYGASVKLLERSSSKSKHIVIAPGENPQTCFLANSVAGLIEAPVLLSRNDALPDIVAHAISDTSPKSLLLIHLDDQYDSNLRSELEECFDCEVEHIRGASLDELALNCYRYGIDNQLGWSDTCLLTHKDCISDHISISPYTYKEKVPIFFNTSPGVLSKETMNCLTKGSLYKILILGGYVSYPEDLVSIIRSNINNVVIKRLFAEEGYKASAQIANWMISQNIGCTLDDILVSSVWFPENALSAGHYCASRNNVILMEDPQNLDSVITTFNYISSNKDKIGKLTFLGNASLYNDLDKQILAKALTLPPVEQSQ